VGSGCSGAVAASVLSSAGLSVIVADMSYYWPPQHLPMSETDASRHLFSNGGVRQTDDSSVAIISGSCWGGGGTVNWSASLQLQAFVRQQWADQSGNPYFTSAAFQADMDAVCETMGVSTAHIEHNFTNKTLLEGARRLGMKAAAVPQNTGGKTHQCGYCTLGCGSCGKKGPTESWLPDAARAGAQFIEGFTADRVLFSDDVSYPSRQRKAIGVQGTWTSRDSHGGVSGSDRHTRTVTLKARHSVVLAAGPFGTPLLLHRSGVRNQHLGRHLHLHPVALLGAQFDTDVRPWEGPILTALVNDLENIDGAGHGVKLEATTMLPGFWLPVFPWVDGLDWKLFCANMRRHVGYISLARDASEGRVYPDPKDAQRPCVAYAVNKADGKNIAAGLEALAKIAFVGGAREIFVSVPGVPTFVRSASTMNPSTTASTSSSASDAATDAAGINDPSFQTWLQAHVRPLQRTGLPRHTTFASAHQMGTARMGSSPSSSVVGPEGNVWGVEGLYVVDTSVFPSACGVNPMVTCMALARRVARGIVSRWRREGEVGGFGDDLGKTDRARARL